MYVTVGTAVISKLYIQFMQNSTVLTIVVRFKCLLASLSFILQLNFVDFLPNTLNRYSSVDWSVKTAKDLIFFFA